MMYDFVDTLDIPEGYSLPSEAIAVDGVVLDGNVDGYRTLYTKGRESLAREINAVETNNSNGSFGISSRFPERVITVGFQIIAEDAESFRESFNQLNAVLNVEDVQIIFADEDDKFFIGTPVMTTEVEPGRNAVVGEFEIHCLDPFKYSLALYEALPDEEDGKTFNFAYNGTYPSHPIVEATMAGTQKRASEETEPELVHEYFWSEDSTYATGGEWSEEYEDDETGNLYLFERIRMDYPDGTSDYYPGEDGDVYPVELEQEDPEEPEDDEDEHGFRYGENGFIAFTDGVSEATIQLGNPLEPDEETYDAKQTLFTSQFNTASSWDAEMRALWPTNSGAVTSATMVPQGTVDVNYASNWSNKTKLSSSLLKTAQTTSSHTKKEKKKSVVYNKLQVCPLKVTASGRKTSSVKLTVSLSVKALSKIEKKAKVVGKVSIGSTDHTFTIKSSGSAWSKGTKKTITKSFTHSGLASSTSKLTSVKFSVTTSGGSGGGNLSTKNCKSFLIPTYRAVPTTGYYITPSSYGSGINKKYTGPNISRSVPADSSGDTNMTMFNLNWSTKFCTGPDTNDVEAMGAQQILLSDADGTVVCGVGLYKKSTAAKGTLRFYWPDGSHEDKSISMTYDNCAVGVKYKKKTGTKKVKDKKTGKKKKVNTYSSVSANHACSIMTDGGYLKVDIGGVYTAKKKLTGGMEIRPIKKVTFGFYQYGSFPPMAFNGVYGCSLERLDSAEYKNLINVFSTGDVVQCDTATGEITLNGSRRPDIGALGNDYEDFVLTNDDLNFIVGAWSSWVQDGYEPKLRILFREVYL